MLSHGVPPGQVDERWLQPVRVLIDAVRDLASSRAAAPERVAELEVLALRWRCLAELIGQDLIRKDPDMRKAFALLMDAARSIPADRPNALNPDATSDWIAALGEARERLAELQETARARAERACAVAILFDDLRSLPTRYVLPEDEEGLRLLREGITGLAAYLPLREELAKFALPYREALGDGFGFLWKKKRPRGEGEETKSGRLTRREILERMLGRMVAKHTIGAVHAPVELILRGFPPHQDDQAKEALGALCAAGLVVRKSTNYGERVFLDPGPLRCVKSFLAGGSFGIAALDLWTTRDALEEAA